MSLASLFTSMVAGLGNNSGAPYLAAFSRDVGIPRLPPVGSRKVDGS
jgi:hypothetical protein